ncbi:hypothetical protein IMZ31_20845 (plasmid) [Pontibacillus sp. ALD_SL1]|uniref:hypothetical protein n=1 Tax=Pontibacillus sp. ALD_SL1 TaxID=2777185 RepID=UPI001A95E548|nr:hypothetical protein [Pontibacillus sp. ALD_SL1]QST02998.1 hypothetical protein IMZ31_20845 [Pontibacillus sp. ALD_SL1]
MSQVETIQLVQFFVLALLLVAIGIQLVRMWLKYRVHRMVYGKGLDKYVEHKALEQEFKLNKSKTTDTN